MWVYRRMDQIGIHQQSGAVIAYKQTQFSQFSNCRFGYIEIGNYIYYFRAK